MKQNIWHPGIIFLFKDVSEYCMHFPHHALKGNLTVCNRSLVLKNNGL